ncbi:MAG: hypothetical protein IPM20_10510 [Gammaproteobacteria bacterium]|nr:hypothetical protein [Gammaproteobacteria bacterium]
MRFKPTAARGLRALAAPSSLRSSAAAQVQRYTLHRCLRLRFIPILFLVAGCSTGSFLRPSAEVGTYSTVNPACPGAPEVINFIPVMQQWVLLRVYATPPGRIGSKGTELRIHITLRYWNDLEPIGLFPRTEKRKKWEKVIEERSKREYNIVASSPYVSVVLPNGEEKKIKIPLFTGPHNPKEDRTSWWANGVQVSPDTLREFTVVLPDVFVNNEKFIIAPIKFKLDKERYAPVLNC